MALEPHLNGQGLRAQFHGIRRIGVVISVVASMMLVLRGEGLTIKSFRAGEKDNGYIKRVLDYYNPTCDDTS